MIPEGMEALPMRKLDDKTLMPQYKELFLKVFSEESFKDLPLKREWDHVINLVEGAKGAERVVLPTISERTSSPKRFLEDKHGNRQNTGKQLSFTSPFFFRLKQGTGELREIQDY
jgi:hypothetical protein